MTKKLKSLDEHNSTSWAKSAHNLHSPVPNGLACPKCKKELMDSNPMVTLTSWPAQKNIHCINEDCDYVGFRFV